MGVSDTLGLVIYTFRRAFLNGKDVCRGKMELIEPLRNL